MRVLTMYTVRKPVNRCPLHAAYVGATLYAMLILVTAQGAWAHVDVQPRLVVQGATTETSGRMPHLRPGAVPERLELTGNGIETLSTSLQGVKGSETVWTVRVRTSAAPGQVPILLHAVFADWKSVDVHEMLTILPSAAPSSSFPWPATIVGALLAAALVLGVHRVARRRTA